MPVAIRPLAALLALFVLCCGGRAPAPTATPGTEALLERARAHERSRQYQRARELYQRAIATAPDAHSAGHASREFASALIFWGEYEAAELALLTCVRHQPREPAAWHDLGLVRAHLGKLSAAEKSLRRAVSLAPADPRPRVALAALLVNRRDYQAARREYRGLLELDLNPRIRRAVHRALRLLSDSGTR